MKTEKLLGRAVFNQRCLCHGLSPRSVLIFSVVFWTYYVCVFWPFLINADIPLLRQLYSKTRFYSTLQFRETMNFLRRAMFVENQSNRSCKVQIPCDICTHFWVLFVLYWVKLNNDKQSLDEVFVISGKVKVEVSVISLAEGRGW